METARPGGPVSLSLLGFSGECFLLTRPKEMSPAVPRRNVPRRQCVDAEKDEKAAVALSLLLFVGVTHFELEHLFNARMRACTYSRR